ncbi:MAG: hypothetical protein K9J12_04810 [Melioribacteraceae bacterium]|nr:hypothetical protein [Melioribacteraceae bacterium]MCF8264496.1 hypothetical protein [Melioribacteraceae bacterium]MCF8411917.1 hypothetical protein [Melioribacteraceae bacterium]MCF8430948.1 hypothetical protein [Melioribacteraceae bacterium]
MDEIKRRRIEKYGGYLFKIMAMVILVTLVYRFFFHVSTSEETTLVGEWKYLQVLKDGDVLENNQYLLGDKSIILYENGVFETIDESNIKSVGKWSYNENTRMLSLDDKEREGDEQYWIVTFLHNKVKLSGIQNRNMDGYEIILVRE